MAPPPRPSLALESLPPGPKPSGSTAGITIQQSSYNPLPPPRYLPPDAPNIIIVLIDDAGPALPDTYGGEIHTPALSRVADQGISYNRFHTTAMCSPTRASLLTGRNCHRVESGQIAELANDWDGYSGEVPKSSAMVAEVLKDYGYSTAAFGKWHNTPAMETTSKGPFERCHAIVSCPSTASLPEPRPYEPSLVASPRFSTIATLRGPRLHIYSEDIDLCY